MSIAHKLTLLASLTAAGLSMTSCNKTAEYDLQTINDISLQVSSFGINSSSNAAITNYFFSITNTSGTGLITNQIPLPYGTELTDVTLSLSLLAGNYSTATSVKVAVGNGEAVEWDATKKFTIPIDTELTITVASKTDATQSYTYKVKINQYKYDPETISWTNISTATTAIFGDNLPAFVFKAPDTGLSYIAKQGTQSVYLLSESAVPTQASFTGLASGENIKRVVSDDSSVYALGSLGNLYQLQGTVWTALSGGTGVYDLLGILPVYGTETNPTLALLLTPDRSTTLDTNLDAGKRALYGVYKGGTISVSTNYAPSTFPGLKSSDHFLAFAQTASYVGASLDLVSATTSDELGKSYRSTWFTTNGTKWATDNVQTLESSIPTAVSFVASGGVYYRLESGSEGLSVYYSSDKKTWTKSSDVALGGLDQTSMQNARFVAWSRGEYIYILQGTGASSTLWQGKIKKSETE